MPANPAVSTIAHDLSRAFRPILEAMARPGRIQRFSASPAAPPPGLSREAAAVAVTLCDFQTPVWLSPTLHTPAVAKFLRFHAGTPLVDKPERAAFAFADTISALPPLKAFMRGTPEYPDRSATLVIEVEDMSEDAGVMLTGPGIKGTHSLRIAPPSNNFWLQMAQLHTYFPLGIDVIFVAEGRTAALPRSTRVSAVELA